MNPWIGLHAIGGGAFFLFLTSLYNTMVINENRVDQVAANIQALLKKRFNVIPNLVATVEQYTGHEQSTLKNITALRSGFDLQQAGAVETLEVDDSLNQLLGRLKVQVEAYPELKADSHYHRLMEELIELERNLAVARGSYNQAVTDYNNSIQTFPNFIVANILDFKERPWYSASSDALEPPSVRELIAS